MQHENIVQVSYLTVPHEKGHKYMPSAWQSKTLRLRDHAS